MIRHRLSNKNSWFYIGSILRMYYSPLARVVSRRSYYLTLESFFTNREARRPALTLLVPLRQCLFDLGTQIGAFIFFLCNWHTNSELKIVENFIIRHKLSNKDSRFYYSRQTRLVGWLVTLESFFTIREARRPSRSGRMFDSRSGSAAKT